MSMEKQYLAHYGVKGMVWGNRKPIDSKKLYEERMKRQYEEMSRQASQSEIVGHINSDVYPTANKTNNVSQEYKNEIDYNSKKNVYPSTYKSATYSSVNQTKKEKGSYYVSKFFNKVKKVSSEVYNKGKSFITRLFK